jgi:peptide/nickel transport system permease protein
MSSARKLTPSAWIGLVMLGAFIVIGVLGPLLAPYAPDRGALAARFAPASAAHWLGTDSTGIDTFSQLLWGAREALIVSTVVVSVSSTIGVALGTIAGWFGGWVDELVMRFVDVLLAFPGILLNIAIVATIPRPGIGTMIVALCANGWVGYARIARGEVLALRERDYVTAAVALGASHRRVMSRYLIPNLLGPVFVQMAVSFGTVIIIEATLSFIGLGPQLPYTWGAMLAQGTTFLWKPGFLGYLLAPSIAITWVMIGANLLSDGLRDRFDPRHRGRG